MLERWLTVPLRMQRGISKPYQYISKRKGHIEETVSRIFAIYIADLETERKALSLSPECTIMHQTVITSQIVQH